MMRKILTSFLAASALLFAGQNVKADKVDDNTWTLPGTYTLTIAEIDGQFIDDEIEIDVKITAGSNGSYTMRDVSGEKFPTDITFTYNEGTGALTFSSQSNWGYGNDGSNVYFSPAGFEWPDLTFYNSYSNATFNSSTGEITFGGNTRWDEFVFAWPTQGNVYNTAATYQVISAQQQEITMEQGDFELPGLYEFTLKDPYGGNPDIRAQVRITENGGSYIMEEVNGSHFASTIPFQFNASNNKLTFSETLIEGTTYFAPMVYEWPDVTTYPTYSDVVFSSIDGSIDFQSALRWGYFGFCWTDKSAYFPSYDPIYVIDSAIQIEDTSDQEPEWHEVGEATFMDGWILPMLGIDQNNPENQYKVMLLQNRDNEYLYRLKNPYASGPAADQNIHSTKEGFIEFDVTDPEHVVFNKVEAGFAFNNPRDGEQKFNQFYCMNFLGYYILRYPSNSKEQIISMLGSQMCFTTFENGVVELGYKDFGGGDITYDAHYGTEDPTKVNCSGYWPDANMSARIIFPGYEGPTVEEPTEGDITGNMTTQIDMSMGYGDEPDLDDPETFEVTASFDEATNVLTIFNFAELRPIKFTVDLATGNATATDQLAYREEFEDDGEEFVFDYYYGNVLNGDGTVTAKVMNAGENKTRVIVDPWGECLPDYDYFFNTAYFNTDIILDAAIPGLQANEPTLSVEISHSEQVGDVVFTVNVTADGLTDADPITVYYKGPNQEDYVAVSAPELMALSVDKTYTFSLDNLAAQQAYTVSVYAQSGVFKSETVEYSFFTSDIITGIEEIGTDSAKARYFNLQGVEIANPEPGNIYIKVEGKKAVKVVE